MKNSLSFANTGLHGYFIVGIETQIGLFDQPGSGNFETKIHKEPVFITSINDKTLNVNFFAITSRVSDLR